MPRWLPLPSTVMQIWKLPQYCRFRHVMHCMNTKCLRNLTYCLQARHCVIAGKLYKEVVLCNTYLETITQLPESDWASISHHLLQACMTCLQQILLTSYVAALVQCVITDIIVTICSTHCLLGNHARTLRRMNSSICSKDEKASA